MEHVEDNILIALFDGWVLSQNKTLLTNPFKKTDRWHPRNLGYHTSFYWLIPIVVKIRDEFPQYDESPELVEVLETAAELDLDDTYNAVVKFVKWHNNNQNKSK